MTIFLTQVLATIVGCVFADSVNYWAYFLMFLTGRSSASSRLGGARDTIFTNGRSFCRVRT
ncbi:hypothetical protein [Paractinoplanes toevensis]|uniref:hypothetical protein n=1 Tax=Paractinoplanes toevensis TaxID=571911 RepID=UPI001BB32C94|nr:hypothetical protein [Actinoplanes toevensis]